MITQGLSHNEQLASLVMTNPEAEDAYRRNEDFYASFVPRPDDIANFDEQHSFITNQDRGVAWHIGGNASGTTEAACCKISRFVLNKQPPPRKNTPFWIVGPSYEQTIESCWCEKLEGHGHIPESEIDRSHMTWYDRRKNQPFTIPLKPWPGHNPDHNWRLEFKSYEQGRDQMQARALGGYCFIEQFPHELLIEVHRGTRETNYPGSRFCEFTPIDPAKNIEIQEMIENDDLPDGWAVYRSNTRKNMADPRSIVTQDWGDGFFSMVSDEMQETRQLGRLPALRARYTRALIARYT